MSVSSVYYTLVEKCLHWQLLEVFKNRGGGGGGTGRGRGKAKLYLETRKIKKPNRLILLPCGFWKDIVLLKFPVNWHVRLI